MVRGKEENHGLKALSVKRQDHFTGRDSHPWLSTLTRQDEDDSVEEVIRYTLDEVSVKYFREN